jgi:small ligand-binding sensory domain FIST
MSQFHYGHAAGTGWRQTADACLRQLGEIPSEASLGFLYVTDQVADDLSDVLSYLRQSTGVKQWVGTVGIGICATGAEYYDQPAIAVMLGEFPPDDFRVLPTLVSDLGALDAGLGDWVQTHPPYLGLVHGDASNSSIEDLVQQLARRTSTGFLVGGFASSRGTSASVANGINEGGLSGVFFADRVGVATSLTQGCSPIGPSHTISESKRNVVVSIDGRPAFEVLKEDIGDDLAAELDRLGGYIFAGLPIQGSDTADYLVRNLVAVDSKHGLIAIGELVAAGQQLIFCRRDEETAREDLDRMLRSLKRRLTSAPRGGIYVSCLGRGINLFGEHSAELRQIQATLGDIPIVGFYANGEISQDRVYGYTGVLTLFL